MDAENVTYTPYMLPAYIRTTSMVVCIIVMVLGIIGNLMVGDFANIVSQCSVYNRLRGDRKKKLVCSCLAKKNIDILSDNVPLYLIKNKNKKKTQVINFFFKNNNFMIVKFLYNIVYSTLSHYTIYKINRNASNEFHLSPPIQTLNQMFCNGVALVQWIYMPSQLSCSIYFSCTVHNFEILMHTRKLCKLWVFWCM